jgi:hypothetical protein
MQRCRTGLVKEMRLCGIDSIAEGNAFLPAFMEKYNARFAGGFLFLSARPVQYQRYSMGKQENDRSSYTLEVGSVILPVSARSRTHRPGGCGASDPAFVRFRKT